MKKTISIIVPLYQEENILEELLTQITNEVQELPIATELFLIDDGSTDNSWSKIEQYSQSLSFVRGIRLTRNFGKESAVSAGLDHVDSDAVIIMDGDLQHPTALIKTMVKKWLDGADVVEANRTVRQKERIIDRVFAKLFYRIVKIITKKDISRATDFKLLDRKVLNAWRALKERNVFFRGMVDWLGFSTIKVDFIPLERASGKSKWSIAQRGRLALDMVVGSSIKPLLFVWSLFLIIGFIFILQIVAIFNTYLITKLITDVQILALISLFIGSCILLALSILSSYMALLFQEIKGRPRYVIDAQTENIK